MDASRVAIYGGRYFASSEGHEAKRKQLLAKCQAELDALNAKSVEILDQFNLGSNEAAMELLAKLES